MRADEQILLVSRCNNETAEITGALLFRTNFSQVLEGPRAEVERLYPREARQSRKCRLDTL